MKQDQVARILQIPISAVSAMETGKRKVDAVELFTLARLYRKPMEWFFSHHPELNTPLEPPNEAREFLMAECMKLLRAYEQGYR